MSSHNITYVKILDLIESFSKGDLDSRIDIQGTNSELNTIAERLNTLGESLSVSKKQFDVHRFFIGSILNKIPVDIAVFDNKHNYLFINGEAVADEKTREWLIGKNDFDYVKFKGLNNDIAVKRRTLFDEAVTNKTDVQWVDEHSKEGKVKYVLRKLHPVFENGQLKYVIGYGVDISELKAVEREKTQLIDELNNKYNDMMQFNYIVSHNLRSPLASIMGLSDIISMPAISEKERANAIDHIRNCVHRMDELLKDLSVLLSRSSTLNTLKENIDVTELIHSITDTLESQITESKAIIKTEISKNAKTISSIKSYLESILFNLISNAIKYKSPDRVPEILITITKNNDHFIMTIKDNGIGIDLAKHGESVFGLYKRFNVETEGKGLGLHMTKTQVKTLGGTISVKSELDKGTMFTVTLPLK